MNLITKKPYTILAIESSCDDTSAAVYTSAQGLLSNEVYTESFMHNLYGGVVPEIASRSHLEKINLVVQAALQISGKSLEDIDAFAVTSKPGLPGSLIIGFCFAKGLAWAMSKPIIAINHLEGHAFSACVENSVEFPALCLTVSGGHTSLYLLQNYGDYQVLGGTLDDAAGEAFDKIARMLGFGYPGGPIIEKLAQEANFEDFFFYPRGSVSGYDFSFSGLKTAVLYDLVKKEAYDMAQKKFLRSDDVMFVRQVASSLLVCIKDVFIKKIEYALSRNPEIKSVCFVGGVACNNYLRMKLSEYCASKGIKLYSPSKKLCTDNAGMIAFVGHYKAQQEKFDSYEIGIL